MVADIRTANQAWEALLTAHSVIMRRFADEPVWREHGVSMREYDVLYTLAKCEAPARMGELQGGVLLLMLLAVAFGIGVQLLRRVLLGPAFRSSSLPAAVPLSPCESMPTATSSFALPARSRAAVPSRW